MSYWWMLQGRVEVWDGRAGPGWHQEGLQLQPEPLPDHQQQQQRQDQLHGGGAVRRVWGSIRLILAGANQLLSLHKGDHLGSIDINITWLPLGAGRRGALKWLCIVRSAWSRSQVQNQRFGPKQNKKLTTNISTDIDHIIRYFKLDFDGVKRRVGLLY